MKAIWFIKTRWFWRPLTAIGWLVLTVHGVAALSFNSWVWLHAIDDQNLMFMLLTGNGFGFLWFDWLARRASYRDGRHCPRRQRDPEAWT